MNLPEGLNELAKLPGALVVGDLFRRILGPTADAVGDHFAEKLKRFLSGNVNATCEQAGAKLLAANLEPKPVPPRLLIPILESCSVEDDPTLQDMWAGLMATASNDGDSLSPSFVETLKQLSPSQAKLLNTAWLATIRPQLERCRREAVALVERSDMLYREHGRSYDLETEIEKAKQKLPSSVALNWRSFSTLNIESFERLGLLRREYSVSSKEKRDVGAGLLTGVDSQIGYNLNVTGYAMRFLEACHGPRMIS